MTQIIDISFSQDTSGLYDLEISENGDFQTVAGFDTALLMSIYCERRASASQVPDVSRRRGWIGNEDGEIEGFEIGSLVWLYYQARAISATANGIDSAAREGLQWLLDDGYANRIDVKSDVYADSVLLDVTISIVNKPVETRNFELWQNTGVV